MTDRTPLIKRRTITAGVFDSGLASLATFAIGIIAARYLEPAIIGCYALAFAAFKVASTLPRELVFVPAEIEAVAYPHAARLGLLPSTLRLGLWPTLVGGVLVAFWGLSAPSGIPADVIIALTVTVSVCTFLSPVQDHLRRMLHIGGRSSLAVGVSMVQVVGTVLTLVGLLSLDVPKAWIPFGTLAVANLLSLTAGGLLLRGGTVATPTVSPWLDSSHLMRTGKVLLGGALLIPGGGFVASVLVSHLAGAEALGYAEAARVLARPLPVLAAGLAAVFRPLSIAAAQKQDRRSAQWARTLYVRIFLAVGLCYMALVAADVGWNPLTQALPNAYVVSGLVAAAVLGEIVSVTQLPYRYELLGSGRVMGFTRVEIVGAVLRSATAVTAGFTYSFAIPLGQAVLGAVRSVGYRRALRGAYGEDRGERSPEGAGAMGEVSDVPQTGSLATS